jgi:hypothetical protein
MRCTAYKVSPDDGIIYFERCRASNGKHSLITRILYILLVCCLLLLSQFHLPLFCSSQSQFHHSTLQPDHTEVAPLWELIEDSGNNLCCLWEGTWQSRAISCGILYYDMNGEFFFVMYCKKIFSCYLFVFIGHFLGGGGGGGETYWQRDLEATEDLACKQNSHLTLKWRSGEKRRAGWTITWLACLVSFFSLKINLITSALFVTVLFNL